MEVGDGDHAHYGAGAPRLGVPCSVAGHRPPSAHGTQTLAPRALSLLRLGHGRPDFVVSTLPSTDPTTLMSAELAIFRHLVCYSLLCSDACDSTAVGVSTTQ